MSDSMILDGLPLNHFEQLFRTPQGDHRVCPSKKMSDFEGLSWF